MPQARACQEKVPALGIIWGLTKETRLQFTRFNAALGACGPQALVPRESLTLPWEISSDCHSQLELFPAAAPPQEGMESPLVQLKSSTRSDEVFQLQTSRAGPSSGQGHWGSKQKKKKIKLRRKRKTWWSQGFLTMTSAVSSKPDFVCEMDTKYCHLNYSGQLFLS